MCAQPLVSISIITYNQIDFIREAMNSALSQDYENLEVVVADDGSTDGTTEVILEYAEKYPRRIVPLVGGPNLGITGNSNRALRACKGKYVAFQGGDDVLLPGKIKAQVAWLEEDAKRVLCYHDVELFESVTGKVLGNLSETIAMRSGDAETVVLYSTFMCGTSVMLKIEACPDVEFDSRIPVSSDWLFWVDALAKAHGNIGFIEGVYARYRRHSVSVTASGTYYEKEYFKTLYIIKQSYPDLASACENRYSVGFMVLAKKALHQGQISKGVKLLGKAFLPRYGFGFFGVMIFFKRLFRIPV